MSNHHHSSKGTCAKTSKAQIAVTDLFITTIVFVILLIIIFSFFRLYSLRYIEDVAYQEMELVALSSMNLLVNTQGNPSGWENFDFGNPADVAKLEVIGLAFEDKNLSMSKVNALFLDLSDDKIEELLNIERFSFYLNLTDLNENSLIEGKGQNPGINPDGVGRLIRVRRSVYINDEPAILFFSLWTGSA